MSTIQSRGDDQPQSIVECSVHGAALLSGELIESLSAALDRVEDLGDGAQLVIRVVGDPTTSMTKAWPGKVGVETVNKWEREIRRLERALATTTTVIEGCCTALGLELLLATDCRMARPNLRLVLREPNLHAWPGMAVYRLANQLGVAHARHLILRSQPLTAANLLELSIVDFVVEDAQTSTADIVRSATGMNVGDVPVLRRLLLDASKSSFEDALGLHLAACDRTLRRHAVADHTSRNTSEATTMQPHVAA